MSSKSKNKLNLLSRLARLGEFPVECTGTVPVVEVKGMCEAYVSGCTRIIEYTECNVTFEAKGQSIIICGEELVLSDYTAGSVCVSGSIYEIKFSR